MHWCANQQVLCASMSQTCYLALFVDMSGIIPEEEEEEQEMYDDVGALTDTAEPVPIDEDIYEELPGPTACFITVKTSAFLQNMNKLNVSLWGFFSVSKVLFSATACFWVHQLDRIITFNPQDTHPTIFSCFCRG